MIPVAIRLAHIQLQPTISHLALAGTESNRSTLKTKYLPSVAVRCCAGIRKASQARGSSPVRLEKDLEKDRVRLGAPAARLRCSKAPHFPAVRPDAPGVVGI